ncbi:MAG: type III secretion system export apparatus subunit SctS [Steroidobacteraceae bacterium]
MDTAVVIDASYRALMLVLYLSLPAVITAGAVGLLTAVAQAVTQIQDQGISQALKLIAVLIALALSSKWIAVELYHAADQLLNSIGMDGANVH